MKQEQYDIMLEEINSVTNPVHKDILLQKYGMIDPKLTELEKLNINFEETWGSPMRMIGTWKPEEEYRN